jgi:hypothetical protein
VARELRTRKPETRARPTVAGELSAFKAGCVVGHRQSKDASQGLLFPSETDAPFEPFEWPGEEGKPEKGRVLELAGVAAGTPIKVKSLDSFFKDATQEEDWQDPEEKAEAQKFRQLVKTLKEVLADPKVFLVGRSEADAYLVGRTDAGWAGLKTRVVQS